jgi:hypothetical protein
MSDIKINPQTGQIAVPNPNGGFKIYEKGQYKQNPQTGQYAVPTDDGKWSLYDGPSVEVDERRGEATGTIPTEEPGTVDKLGRQLGLTGRYLLEGPANLAATFIGNPANATINAGIKGVNELAGTDIEYLQKPSDMVGPALDAAGFPKPEGAVERVVGEASKFVSSGAPFAKGGQLVGQYGPEALKGLGVLGENLMGQGVGAVTGGTAYGVTKEVLPDSPTAQLAATLLGGVGGSAAVAKLSEIAQRAAVPTTQAVKGLANQAYKASEEAGAIIKPEAVQRLVMSVTDDLAEQAYIPLNAPKVGAVVEEMKRIAAGNVTLKGLDALRQAARDVANSADPAEARLGSRMISQIDDMVQNLKPADILQGSKNQGINELLKGRTLWGAARKSELIDDMITKATDRASTSGTGGNVENAIRQNLRKILDSKRLSRGFTKDELAAIRQVVKGSWKQNVLRQFGILSPRTGALMQSIAGGAVVSDVASGVPILTPIIAAGTGAKMAADTLSKSAATGLSRNIRAAATGTQPVIESAGVRAARALAQGGQTTMTPALRALLERYGVLPGAAVADPNNTGQTQP